jgi:hypothetical protein
MATVARLARAACICGLFTEARLMGISEAVADRYNEYFLRNLIMCREFVVQLEIAYWLRVACGADPRSPQFEAWVDDYYGVYYIDAPDPEPFVGPLKPAPFTRQGYRVVSMPILDVSRPPILKRKRLAEWLDDA